MQEESRMPVNKSLSIDYSSMNIEKCFQNFYLVPDYQREYVWEEKQVSQLLQDLIESFQENPNKEYYLGSIVVCQNEDGFYELIDGQQRITTFFIMICAFRQIYNQLKLDTDIHSNLIYQKKFNAAGEPVEHYRLSLQYSDAADYLERISRNEDMPSQVSSSGKRMFEAYELIKETLVSNFKDEKSLKLFFMFFYQKVIFIQIETSYIGDALKIFETINHRGVGLNPMDLLKNLIFRQVEKEMFNELNTKWKTMVDCLDKAGEKPLRFLRYFIISNYDIDSSRYPGGVVREDAIYEWFVDNRDQCQYDKYPLKFVEFMIQCQIDYVNFINGRDRNGNNAYLENIIRLGGGAYRLHLLLLLPARNLESKLFNHLCRQVESLIYYALVTRQGTNEIERLFAQWSAMIRRIKTKDQLNEFINNKMIPTVNSWMVDYEARFMSISRKNMQLYRIRYILAKIAQYMDIQKLAADTSGTIAEYMQAGVEVEHILPQTRNEVLKELYPDEEQYDQLKSRLGNLTLLEKVPNIVNSNLDFYKTRLAVYECSKYYITKSIARLDNIGKDNSLTRLNKRIKSWNYWDENTIEERQRILYDLSFDVWKIKPID